MFQDCRVLKGVHSGGGGGGGKQEKEERRKAGPSSVPAMGVSRVTHLMYRALKVARASGDVRASRSRRSSSSAPPHRPSAPVTPRPHRARRVHRRVDSRKQNARARRRQRVAPLGAKCVQLLLLPRVHVSRRREQGSMGARKHASKGACRHAPRVQSKTARFSRMRSSLTDLGM